MNNMTATHSFSQVPIPPYKAWAFTFLPLSLKTGGNVFFPWIIFIEPPGCSVSFPEVPYWHSH